MNVIQRLNVEHASRIRYFLSKADTVPNERDRQKVVCRSRRWAATSTSSSNAATTTTTTTTTSILHHHHHHHSQNLSSKIRNAHAFELPSLYIPDMMPSGTKSSIENVLEHTCVEMEQTINQNVQNTLNKMEGDCKTITAKIDSLMAKDNEGRGACLPRPPPAPPPPPPPPPHLPPPPPPHLRLTSLRRLRRQPPTSRR